jgi:hypothetical protein
MATLGDYSSVFEIGITLNLASSYINLFINPAMTKAEKELSNFRWWHENPQQLEAIRGKKVDPGQIEESYAEWFEKFGVLQKKVEKLSKQISILTVFSAVVLYLMLFFPELPATLLVVLLAVVFSIGPLICGACYLWIRSRTERVAERRTASNAKEIFSKVGP